MSQKSPQEKRLLIAGGGTGGHVLAGVAVADSWCSRSILFVGATRGIESRLVPKYGYPVRLLRIGSLNHVGIKRRLLTTVQLPFALIHSFWILLSFRPHSILGVGGYASGPLVITAGILKKLRLLRVKIAILEQNSVPGLTNRLLGKVADLIFAAFPGTEQYFQGKLVTITGNPIRSSMKLMPPALSDVLTVFIFGGSQGAFGMNTLVLEALPHLAQMNKFQGKLKFIHQTGEKDFERVQAGYRSFSFPVHVEKFIDDMPAAYAQSSLLICRAGSSTLAEVAAVGRASILIPLPTAADNHQEKNAKVFSDAGAARLLLQQKSKGEDLALLIRDLLLQSSQLREMEKKVTQFYRPQAAQDVVKQLLNGNDS